MEKDKFNSLEISKQVEEFNKLIKLHGSASAASKSLGYKDESTLRKRFKNKGFIMNSKKTEYIYNNSETVVNSNRITAVNNKKTKVINESITFDKEQFTALTKEIQELKNFKDDVYEMLLWYKNQRNKELIIDIESPSISINKSKFIGKAYTKGLKVYPSVIDEFKSFCDEYKEFKQQDLLAMAIIEYMEKYKNK